MSLPHFEYLRPDSLDHALLALAGAPAEAMLLAGGTDLLEMMKEGLLRPRRLVSLQDIPGLRSIRKRTDFVEIGPATRIADLADDPVIRKSFPALAEAAARVAVPQIRNAATVAGNLCQRPRCWYFRGGFPCLKHGGGKCYAVQGENTYHAVIGGGPCYIVHPSDLAPVLIAYDARIEIVSPRGRRTLPAAELFVPPNRRLDREIVLGWDEIITRILLPFPPPGTRAAFIKAEERGAFDFALASATAVATLQNGRCRNLRLVFGAIAPIPWISPEANRMLEHQPPDPDRIRAAVDQALVGSEVLEYNRYKRILARNLGVHVLRTVFQV